MPTQLPEDARRRLEEGQRELRDGVAVGEPKATAPAADQGAIRVTSIDGSVRWINPEGSDAAASIWTPEDEKRISACVFDGRAAVRSELEGLFSGKEWPALAALVEPFRRYAVAVFDVYASAYSHVARTVAAYQEALNQLMLPMVLRDLFGREWDRSPGEKVVRMLWQDGPDGKPEGREVTVVAGNDPDPTCVFYDLLSNAIEHRFSFFEPLPLPAPGEPPGINLPNLEWSQYIGLNERHSLAMAIKPYLEDRVADWRFICAPTAPANSDSTGDTTKNNASRQPAQSEEDTVMAQASMAARASSSTGASAMDSPTRVRFEAGLALAEVTLAQDLKDLGPSLGIAQKYVTSATLTLARCILTPHCAEPYEAIRRAYDFAEWFAAETMKTAWVWLSVFSEMNKSGKLEKYNREGRTEDGSPKGMTESELREWHGCLYEVAHEALDDFVPEFWEERLKYFSDIASESPKPAEAPRIGLDTTAEERGDSVQLDLSKLLDHAQARYSDWRASLREERERRFNDLHRGDLSFGGRAARAIRICQEFLALDVTKHIEIYKAVSDEYRNSEMLSPSQIDKLRELVMTSVRASIGDLRGRLQRDRAASGDPAPLPNPQRYVTLEANALDVVNTKLRVLETEGTIRRGDIVLPTGSSPAEQDMPGRRDLLEVLSEDDPNYEVAKRFYLEAWADSHGLVADGFAGRVTLSDFVEGCVNTFNQAAQTNVAFGDATMIPAKCRELDVMVRQFVRLLEKALTPESKRLGKAKVAAAIDEYSRRVKEIAARSKQQILERELAATVSPLQGDSPPPLTHVTSDGPSDRASAAKKARACTVAKIIRELDQLRPQMFEDQKEYDSLRVRYPDFLAFLIAEQRPDLKTKILAIRASTRHIRLAQEIAAAHHGRQLSTIRDDWKDFKPEEFKHPR